MDKFRIRVLAKTEPDQIRTIQASGDGSCVQCDCDGFDGFFCSHIDAVLCARERAMVLTEDHDFADLLSDLVCESIQPPPSWKASWRGNMAWRGLSTRRRRDALKPIVCFTGKLRRPRSELLREAEERGWETINSPSSKITVLVAEDPMGKSGKLRAARNNGTPILTSDDWESLLLDWDSENSDTGIR